MGEATYLSDTAICAHNKNHNVTLEHVKVKSNTTKTNKTLLRSPKISWYVVGSLGEQQAGSQTSPQGHLGHSMYLFIFTPS